MGEAPFVSGKKLLTLSQEIVNEQSDTVKNEDKEQPKEDTLEETEDPFDDKTDPFAPDEDPFDATSTDGTENINSTSKLTRKRSRTLQAVADPSVLLHKKSKVFPNENAKNKKNSLISLRGSGSLEVETLWIGQPTLFQRDRTYYVGFMRGEDKYHVGDTVIIKHNNQKKIAQIESVWEKEVYAEENEMCAACKLVQNHKPLTRSQDTTESQDHLIEIHLDDIVSHHPEEEHKDKTTEDNNNANKSTEPVSENQPGMTISFFAGVDLSNFWDDNSYALKQYVDAPPTDKLIKSVEKKLGYKLPASYIALMKMHNGGIPKNRSFPTNQKTSWAANHVAITGIYGIGSKKTYSLCGKLGSQFMIKEWGYPAIGVYICDCPSAGHDMILLDYSKCGKEGEPQVVHVDQENNYKITFLASNFDTFIRGLVSDRDIDDSLA